MMGLFMYESRTLHLSVGFWNGGISQIGKLRRQEYCLIENFPILSTEERQIESMEKKKEYWESTKRNRKWGRVRKHKGEKL